MLSKKIFISCATLGSGGAERVISVLSSPFASHYDNVKIILWISAPIFYDIDPRVEIVDVEKNAKSTNLLKKMLWFRKYISKESPDLILSFLYPWSMKVLLSLFLKKVNVVVAERQDPRVVFGGYPVRILRDLLYIKTKGITVQTYENQRYYCKFLQHKLKTVYNPINMPKETVGKGLSTNKEDAIVTVGRLRKEKNHTLLINAFAEFLKTHPSYILRIYGGGEEMENLKQFISEMNLEGKVILMGKTNNVFSAIENAKLFILSSNYEGMPNALLEAMCLGLPCISTKVSGATELIQSGTNGILVDVNNKKQMVDAMDEIVDNPEKAEKLARKASELYNTIRFIGFSLRGLSLVTMARSA